MFAIIAAVKGVMWAAAVEPVIQILGIGSLVSFFNKAKQHDHIYHSKKSKKSKKEKEPETLEEYEELIKNDPKAKVYRELFLNEEIESINEALDYHTKEENKTD